MEKAKELFESLDTVITNLEFNEITQIIYKDALFDVEKVRMIDEWDRSRPCYVICLTRSYYNDHLIDSGYLHSSRYENTYKKTNYIKEIIKMMDTFINDGANSE